MFTAILAVPYGIVVGRLAIAYRSRHGVAKAKKYEIPGKSLVYIF